ncbi:hypothetical protein FV218_20720 [Methylobacterium sp. WL69]|uniref:hypothetical protein n=1 Tax=Methylobacterium sp. WL69 TaxID=2603893 RepID=UPI0011CBB6EB|nr:hypothetical protein [Methylobacterium sp. WL69]TXM66104.1 hypothetical protein FV218_20720 [Methylobacterium sp. WL69]
MTRLLATLCLTTALCLPMAARADDASDRVGVAKDLVQKTLIKNLETGFTGALEKTVASMPEDKADAVRKEVRAEFEKQREVMIDGLSKAYAEKFTLDELKHLSGIYDDKTYQKFQAVNADPASSVTAISQASVTKLLNMLAIAQAGDSKAGEGKAGAPPLPMPAR